MPATGPEVRWWARPDPVDPGPAMALLLLADARLPAGGHGHSGGVEALVDRGLLADVADLERFVAGRVRTGGRVVAAAAAAACALAGSPAPATTGGWPPGCPGPEPAGTGPVGAERAGTAPRPAPDWGRWDRAVSARTPSAAARAASRAQGAALLRTVAPAWPGPAVTALAALPTAHHPLVLGVAAACAGGRPADASALALHHMVGGACTAAVRLLGLDPLAVAVLAARAAAAAGPVVAQAAAEGSAAAAAGDPGLLPADGSPLADVMAELHHRSEATLFAS